MPRKKDLHTCPPRPMLGCTNPFLRSVVHYSVMLSSRPLVVPRRGGVLGSCGKCDLVWADCGERKKDERQREGANGCHGQVAIDPPCSVLDVPSQGEHWHLLRETPIRTSVWGDRGGRKFGCDGQECARWLAESVKLISPRTPLSLPVLLISGAFFVDFVLRSENTVGRRSFQVGCRTS